ncbi:MAG: SMC-Scp complex subunit ScpB [Candidatus Omnitrophica bacterium]|nr:SMC-Scp complex subunit ScpB [Candidatus Omnitrophota bacterium]
MQEEKTLDRKDRPAPENDLPRADTATGPEDIKLMMGEDELKKVIEALIFASDKPLAIKQIKDIVGDVDTRLIRKLVNDLKQEFAATGRSFNICEVAGGFRFMTEPAYGRWLKKLYKIKLSDYLTGPSLETVAIIAYRQPVAKTEIEFIRGVAVDGVINSLQQKGFIKVVGKKDVAGRPYLYGTTSLFLQYFGLNSIDELPALSDFKESDLEFNRPQALDASAAQENTLTGDEDDAKDKDIEK